MRIIPAIDLRDGRVVRLEQGDFARQRAFDHDAFALARRYAEAGADWLHVVDLDGARAGRPAQLGLIARLAACGAHVQAGGGVRTRADVARLLDAGVARVVVGSVAVRAPDTFAEWLAELGAERLCLALDLHRGDDGTWRPAADAWRAAADADADALLARFAAAGLRHVLSTDIAQDGMAEGPNLALYRELAARWPRLDWIASGGVRDRADVDALAAAGVAACVAGTALLDGTLALEEIAACSRAA
ncbi:MAG TPA: 1-(5-phosphoribosyl)-5-[(5-phosphoribosylamino)methylideneamino] imidazole-4-carboxamide isomerase [Dokdonella sp.]